MPYVDGMPLAASLGGLGLCELCEARLWSGELLGALTHASPADVCRRRAAHLASRGKGHLGSPLAFLSTVFCLPEDTREACPRPRAALLRPRAACYNGDVRCPRHHPMAAVHPSVAQPSHHPPSARGGTRESQRRARSGTSALCVSDPPPLRGSLWLLRGLCRRRPRRAPSAAPNAATRCACAPRSLDAPLPIVSRFNELGESDQPHGGMSPTAAWALRRYQPQREIPTAVSAPRQPQRRHRSAASGAASQRRLAHRAQLAQQREGAVGLQVRSRASECIECDVCRRGVADVRLGRDSCFDADARDSATSARVAGLARRRDCARAGRGRGSGARLREMHQLGS